MKDYINGCYTKYGTKPLNAFEIKFTGQIGKYYYVAGENVDGLGVDVYADPNRRNLLFMEHSIIMFGNLDDKTMKAHFEKAVINRLLEMELI